MARHPGRPGKGGRRPRPTLAVWTFTSCDGCQMSLLDMEDELLTLAGVARIAYFPELTRARRSPPYDVSLVEGSITTPHEAERILDVRRRSRVLVALGSCATAGGVQALRNFMEVNELARMIYASPQYIETLDRSSAIAEHVPVDLELSGCPVSKRQVLETVAALLAGRRPNLPGGSVCLECKQRAVVCLTVSRGVPCLGPATRAGCGALCPRWRRACFGCFGPQEAANLAATRRLFLDAGLSEEEVKRELRRFAPTARGFGGGDGP